MLLKSFRILAMLYCLSGYIAKSVGESYLESKYPPDVVQDASLSLEQFIQKYNYPLETHFATTLDNYILRMHRLPRPGGRPVFLMHGLLDSSATWFVMGPWSGFGFYLYDLGYDVWAGNARGNYFSLNHSNYDPGRDKSYWQFTWHEIGYFDLPTMIDHVLQTTKQLKLSYVGHSQGTTSFWVMCSMRPEFNDKISLMTALAPVAFMKHVKAPLKNFVYNFVSVSKDMVTEFMPNSVVMLNTCFRSEFAVKTCVEFLYNMLGPDPNMMNMTMLPVVYRHMPAGANIKQLWHFFQLVDSDRFCQYDHGSLENFKRYKRAIPPDYPLEKITVPIGLHYTYNDYLSSEVDVQRLARKLSNVVDDNLIPNKIWNHVTMLWGTEARELVHKRIVELMRKYE